MSRGRAGIDIDGVLYDWNGQARKLIERKFGFDVGEPTGWYYIREKSKEAWDWLWENGIKAGLFRDGAMLPGAGEFLDKVAEKNDIVLITSRPNAAILDTHWWVSNYRIPAKEVIILGDEKSKSDSCNVCNWYIDDKTDHIVNYKTNPKTKDSEVILVDQPWNKVDRKGNAFFAEDYGATRVKSLNEALAVLGPLV